MASETERKWTPAEWQKAFVLHAGWRWGLILLGGLIIWFSFCLYVSPPVRSTEETHLIKVEENKTTKTDAEPTAIVMAGFAVGLAFIAWAINGLRIRNFEGLGVKIEIPTAETDPRLGDTPPDAKAKVENTPNAPRGVAAPEPAAAAAAPSEAYLAGQVGINKTHTFMLRSSWHALKLLKACQVAKSKNRTFSIREISSRTGMSYDYAFSYFIAACSADVVAGLADPNSGVARVIEAQPILGEKIDEVIEGNFRVALPLEAQKRREHAALMEYLKEI
jgi:hypothetical protein